MISFLNLKHIKSKIELISIWLSYFIVLLILAIFCSNDAGKYGSIFVGINDVLNYSKFGDPKYMLTAALDIANNGWVGAQNDWVFNLWPPGFAILESVIIKVFGEDGPLILILQICASILFASVSSHSTT